LSSCVVSHSGRKLYENTSAFLAHCAFDFKFSHSALVTNYMYTAMQSNKK